MADWKLADYKKLPAKRMVAGTFLFNESGKFLIVKPRYEEGWLLPGGIIEKNESPRETVIREVKEELGLDIEPKELLCIDYTSPTQTRTESVQLIFNGGKLDISQLQNIKLQGEELSEYKFVDIEEGFDLLVGRTRDRTKRALVALKTNQFVYLEDGNFP